MSRSKLIPGQVVNTPLKTLEMSFMDQYYQAKERQASYERNAVDKNGAFLAEITLNVFVTQLVPFPTAFFRRNGKHFFERLD